MSFNLVDENKYVILSSYRTSVAVLLENILSYSLP